MANLHFSLIFLLLAVTPLWAQDKVEREDRIKKRDVPQQALEWVDDAFEEKKSVKWYSEETSGKRSVEAKFMYRDVLYSIEFDTAGVLEDVEIDREWESLPSLHRESIMQTMKRFKKVNIKRVQEQWLGTPDNLEDAFDEGEFENITINYEIEFIATIDGDDALWEGLFTADGQLQRLQKVILRSMDNLNF